MHATKNGRTNGGEFRLSATFWARFVAKHWRKQPLLLRAPFDRPLAEAKDIFQGLLNAGERLEVEADYDTPLKFFINGALLQADVRPHLPSAADGTLEGFARRVRRMVGDQLFGLVLTEYPPFDAQTWLRLREFLRPLYEVIGFPGTPSQTGIFLGDYAKTPLGIHKDPHETFVFVIAGRKRFRTWPAEVFDQDPKNTRTLDYERYLDQAITLDGEPGDVLYWPASYWHVGEPVGGFAASMSLTLFPDARPSMETLEHALRKVSRRLGKMDDEVASLFHPDRLPQSTKQLPRLVAKAVRTLQAVSKSRELEQALEVEWLNRVTSFGFNSSPPPLPERRLKDEEIVRGNPDYPVVWLPRGDDELVCSANGHSFSVGAHPAVVRLLKRLNSGASLRVGELVEKFASRTVVDGVRFEATAEDIRSLVEKLVSLRTVTIEG